MAARNRQKAQEQARARARTRARARARVKAAVISGSVLLGLLALSWSAVWPYVMAAVLFGGIGTVGWWLWRTDRIVRAQDRRWRRNDEVEAGRRPLAEVDAMTGTQFEELVAGLCRRDGCTEVRRVGGSHDNGADVLGRLPDGRTMVIQCKRYTPSSTIASRELRDLLGAKVHFRADLAVFVATTRFSRPSEEFAVEHGILAVHRDRLGLWNNGVPLASLWGVNGRGQGDSRHRARWRQAYDT
ncbi:restriction endonuclease [Streptomyces sp. NPDC087844]|uniref:restriction endonuclease n=1 Tax=Streptomyces sp. NPDC087844 TaxID=3365805 RepID=UPI0038172558